MGKAMVQKLEAIKGGGGSIKVGTTGKISALMSWELESGKFSSQIPVSFGNDSPPVSSSVCSGDSTPRRPKSRMSVGEASSSNKNHKAPEVTRKRHTGTHRIPMLKADNVPMDGTPVRQKPVKKRPGMVEVVDITCGNPNSTWVNPIRNRLKKLGFSKLTESTV
ncbi:uncharacterized protein LOC111397332 isoform X2 [Olea europaea var. sylvestris]|uniref:Uncharacterized protein n=2 Tax=Olea europaea subsp. europaea TaxID=158383 RepID=A0A8S0PAA7_OLEEU|nr:uncharacterized protein LOC111397332 isoform X2 [Olea europaea var. sylvestris]XP_022879960.1 uncharacterized protein LOC111397332 isoform X2 [Olea europaea var. sylvestris]XP_022879961.1 uncharacterized protein LOC111397332 isoform X2 [Olea europaea var. sylvestris]CAA2934228.1 Hypothetical predicted protein [Olea europaea subsp. europaea]